jgi:uncharacterized short protein YbdD (DUF466 family)
MGSSPERVPASVGAQALSEIFVNFQGHESPENKFFSKPEFFQNQKKARCRCVVKNVQRCGEKYFFRIYAVRCP